MASPRLSLVLIIIAVLFLLCSGGLFFLGIQLHGIVEENKDAWWAFSPRAMQVWIYILAVVSLTLSAVCVAIVVVMRLMRKSDEA
jgi:hypothetical protein